MKMSDVFNLPLNVAENELAVIDKDNVIVAWADNFSGESARNCIVFAVNNHDRLTEENKRLRDLLKGVTSEYDDLLGKSIEYVGSHGTSALYQAKRLLSELGGE